MSAPIALRMAFDSGWSHGDPGDGRLRFDSPNIAKAVNIIVNARDAQEALLDELVPSWRVGDVLVIERPGADRNRVVAWVIGPITHMGPCYRVPILVRSVHGGFAAHDEVTLHHHRNVTDVDDAPTPAAIPLAPAPPMAVTSPQAPALIAPMALVAAPVAGTPSTDVAAPMAPIASTEHARPPDPSEVELLRQDNSQLHALLAQLLTDPTTLYAMEHDQK